MKTNKLHHKKAFNTKALKLGALLTITSMIGCCSSQSNTKAKESIHPNTQVEIANDTTKEPKVAIIYHVNGDISLLIDSEILTLDAAAAKYPELTANICKYITKTHGPIQTTENNLEK